MKKKIIITIIIFFITSLMLGLFFVFKRNDEKQKIKEDFIQQLGIEETVDKSKATSGIKIEYESQDIYTLYQLLYNQIEVDVQNFDDNEVVLLLKTVDLENIDKNTSVREMIGYLETNNIKKKNHEIKLEYEFKENRYVFKYNEAFYKAIYYSFFEEYLNG